MTPAAPKVCIVTPTYNHAPYLSECVSSALAQTFEDWEQIIVDDGSTDATPELAKTFRDPRVRYFRREGVGIYRLAETYNFALSMSRAPLVAILEGDDVWLPDRLATQTPLLDDPEVVLAFAEIDVIFDGAVRAVPQWTRDWTEEARRNSPLGSALVPLLSFEGIADPGTWLARRSALDRIGGFRGVPGVPTTDYPTLLALCLQGRFAYTPRPLARWRQHAAQTTNRHAGELLIGCADYAQAFYERELPADVKARLPLTSERLASRVERQRARGRMRQGRSDLLERRWSEARANFRGAFGRGSAFMSAAALAGYLAGCAHLDLELAARLLGKPYFKRADAPPASSAA